MHLTTIQVDAYWARRLEPADLLSLGRHIAACQPCRDALLAAAPPAVLPDLGESASQDGSRTAGHLEYQQIRSYIEADGPAGAASIEDHLAICPACRADVEDLRRFRSEYSQRHAGQAKRPTAAPPVRGQFRWWWLAATAAAFGACFVLLRVPFHPQTGPEPHRALEMFPAILHDSGQSLALDRSGKLRGLPNLPASQSAVLAAILAGGDLPLAPFHPELASNGGPTRSAGEAGPQFAPTDPLARVVLDDRPLFQWTALPGAASYRVEVFDLQGHPAATSPSVPATQWRPDRPLPRGSAYSWQVTAIRAGAALRVPQPPAAEARFLVLDRAHADVLTAALARTPVSHLALSVLYAEAGMDRESLRELQLLEQENPGSPLPGRWRAQLLARQPPR